MSRLFDLEDQAARMLSYNDWEIASKLKHLINS